MMQGEFANQHIFARICIIVIYRPDEKILFGVIKLSAAIANQILPKRLLSCSKIVFCNWPELPAIRNYAKEMCSRLASLIMTTEREDYIDFVTPYFDQVQLIFNCFHIFLAYS